MRVFAKAVSNKVFKTNDDIAAEEQYEMFGRAYVQQRSEIDYWRGVAKLAIITGLIIGAVLTSIAELRTGISLWVYLQGLR
jgi:hypothetical protein